MEALLRSVGFTYILNLDSSLIRVKQTYGIFKLKMLSCIKERYTFLNKDGEKNIFISVHFDLSGTIVSRAAMK